MKHWLTLLLSLVALIGDAHAAPAQAAADQFGVVIEPSGSTPNSHLYCGERFDQDLGLYYLRARYLNPNSGRFWTMDGFEGTQTDPLSLHKYFYAHANPVNMVDPSGHWSLPELNSVAKISIGLNLTSAGVHIYKDQYEALKWDALGIALAFVGGVSPHQISRQGLRTLDP